MERVGLAWIEQTKPIVSVENPGNDFLYRPREPRKKINGSPIVYFFVMALNIRIW